MKVIEMAKMASEIKNYRFCLCSINSIACRFMTLEEIMQSPSSEIEVKNFIIEKHLAGEYFNIII